MTCIVALSDMGTVYMAGDRSYSDGITIVAMQEPKIYTRENSIFGYAGNIGIGQAIAYEFNWPFIDEPEEIHTTLVPRLRKFVKKLGVDIKEDDSSLLIGNLGIVYEMNLVDYQCVPVKMGAVGSGSQYALGSLHSTQDHMPEERVREALRAAIHYSPNCRTPIDFLVL